MTSDGTKVTLAAAYTLAFVIIICVVIIKFML